MTSTLEPSILPLHETYHPFERPTSSNMKLPHPSELPNSKWAATSNIWAPEATEPRRRSVERSESRADQFPSTTLGNVGVGGESRLTRRPSSPASNDSFTRPHPTYRGPAHPTARDTTAVSSVLPVRTPSSMVNSSSMVNTASALVGRSSNHYPAPPHTQVSSRMNPFNHIAMSHLGTATLLNGSAPDVEPGRPAPYGLLSQTTSTNTLHSLNVGVVPEFFPARQNSGHLRSSQSQYAQEGSASADAFNAGFSTRGRPHMLGPNDGMTNFMTFNAETWDLPMSTAPYRNHYHTDSAEKNYLSNGSTFATAHHQGIDLVSRGLQTMRLGDVSEQAQQSMMFPPKPMQRSQQYSPTSPAWSDDALRGTGKKAGNSSGAYSTPVLSHQHAVPQPPPFVPGRSTSGTMSSGLYTPADTPPTATASQDGHSGSGTSTHTSRRSLDARDGTLETGTPYALQPIQMDHSYVQVGRGMSRLPPPYNYAYSSVQLPSGARPDEGTSRRGRSEAHLSADKEHNLSPLLRDFRTNHKTKRFELKDAYHHIVEFSGDQHGSRFIQAKLETATGEEKERVFAEIQENALQLMTDIFGNYVIQKLFEHGTQAQKKILAHQMKGRIAYLTTQVYGCRVVQKALEHVLTDQQASIVKELDGIILDIVENQNGNHVIQKAIERVPAEHIPYVFDAHRGHIVRLSRHNYGCRVVQRMLEYGPAAVRHMILAELRETIPSLIEDQFGNYVMQHIIRNGAPADQHTVVTVVQRQLLHFSKHKFASNVVEAAIERAHEPQRQEMLRDLTSGIDVHGQSQVYGLIRDQYGNYVMQKVLAQLQGSDLNRLVLEIQHHLAALRKYSHGKQVSAMEKALASAIASLGPQYTGRSSPGMSTSHEFSAHAYPAGPAQPARLPRQPLAHRM